eukprot:9917336-Heterocapsa_arctica.AAC.1
MALWAKHANKVNTARNEFPAEFDDATKAKIEAIEKAKAEHELQTMKLFMDKYTSENDMKSVIDYDEWMRQEQAEKDAEWKRQEQAKKDAEWKRKEEAKKDAASDAEAQNTQ